MAIKTPTPPPAYTEHAESSGQPSRPPPEFAAQSQYPRQLPPQVPAQPNVYAHPYPQSPYTQEHHHPYPQQSPYYSPLPPHSPAHHHTHRHPHYVYGPTPIVQQEALLLPYFDPRSAFALQEAAARAKWRFLLALIYALIIMFVLGIATGAEISVEER